MRTRREVMFGAVGALAMSGEAAGQLAERVTVINAHHTG